MADEEYSAAKITVLEGLEAVRRRPGMYIGDVSDGSALHHMIWELVANSLDEHLAGHASRIRVSLEAGIAEVEDDGRGIPVSPIRPNGLTALELAMTTLHGGATLDGHTPHVHISPLGFGMGLAIVNALSAVLDVEVWRDGFSYQQRYEQGRIVTPLSRGVRTNRTGTRIRFQPDPSVFASTRFDRAAVKCRLQELALFNPSLRFELMSEHISEPGGIAGWVPRLARECECTEPEDVFVTRALRNDILVEAAWGWSPGYGAELRSYVGQSETQEGGSHERGFWRGLTLALLAHPSWKGSRPRASRIRERLAQGLTGIVHVMFNDAKFAGPTRRRLISAEAGVVVRDQIAEAFGASLRQHPTLARELIARMMG